MIRKYAWLVFTDWVTILGGIGAIFFTIIATYIWSNPMYLQILFAFIVVGCLVISSYKVWKKEHDEVISLEKRLKDSYSKLDIKVEDIFICQRMGSREFPYILTLILNLTNHKPENTTIKNCTIDVSGITSVGWSDKIYVKDGDNRGSKIVNRENTIFSQGISQQYAISFAFYLDRYIHKITETFQNKSYTLKITDSYNRTHKYKSKTPKNLAKTSRTIS